MKSIILSTLGGEGSSAIGSTSSRVDNGRILHNDTDDNTTNKSTPIRFAATQQHPIIFPILNFVVYSHQASRVLPMEVVRDWPRVTPGVVEAP